MTEGIKKFVELLNTDEAFKAKLNAAAQSYKGESTPEAVYNDVLSPLAKEYGISVSLEEFNEFISSQSNDESLSFDELGQVAGGKARGAVVNGCAVIGFGLGGGGGDGAGGGCVGIGAGWGHSGCVGEGKGATIISG